MGVFYQHKSWRIPRLIQDKIGSSRTKKEFGIDCFEAFSPVAKMTTICILVALEVWSYIKLTSIMLSCMETCMKLSGWINHQVTIFFNLNKVCFLNKYMYGLKHTPHSWFEKFCTTILCADFTMNNSDYSIVIRHSTTSISILLLYVDDMIIRGNDEVWTSQLKNLLHSSVKIKDLRKPTKFFLGVDGMLRRRSHTIESTIECKISSSVS